MDAVVLFDPINSGEKLKAAAAKLGFKVIAVYTRPLTIYETQFHVSEESLKKTVDLILFSDNLEWIYQKLKNSPYQIKGSLPGIDSGIELADQIGHAFQLPSNRIDLSTARRDKGHMRGALKQFGYSCPDFSICKTDQEIAKYVKTHPFPLVIKTPRGAGTSHVYVCENMEDLIRGFHKIRDEANFFGEVATAAVIEDFIAGDEYIINTFSDGKKVHVTDVWIYEKIDTKEFKNIYYNAFSLPFSDRKSKPLQVMGRKIAESFGVQIGPAHLEFKNDPMRGPTLIEIGARLSGGKVPEFLQKYSNFDPYLATIEVFTKGVCEIPEPVAFSKYFGIALCPIFKNGVVKKVIGIEGILKLPSYEAHQLNIREGEILVPTTYLTTTPLLVFLAHADRKQLLKDAKAVHELFQIEV